MTENPPEEEWIRRLQVAAREAVDRVTESTATLQRVLAAATASGISPQQIADEATRFGQTTGATAVQDIAIINSRTWARVADIALRYQNDYLAGMISADRSAEIGAPPIPPSPPPRSDSADWMWWYQRTGAWSTDYQLWINRVYGALIEQAGDLSDGAATRRGADFVRDKLPAYIADLAETGIATFCDLLEIGDQSAQRLVEEVLGAPDVVQLTLEIAGTAGSTVTRTIAIDNHHSEAATVRCRTSAEPGFEIVVTAQDIQVKADAPQELTVFVTLPEEPTHGTVNAGMVRVMSDRDDVEILILCQVRSPETAAVSVRVVDVQGAPDTAEDENNGDAVSSAG